MHRLILTPLFAPHSDVAQGLWHVAQADAQGGIVQETTLATPDLAGWAGDVRVLLLPPSWLSWHAVLLPKLKANQRLQALKGLLEDHVLDDVEQLHFALPPAQHLGSSTASTSSVSTSSPSAPTTWIAVAHKPTLQALCHQLRDLLGRIDHIKPEWIPDQSTRHAQLHEGALWSVASTPQGVHALPAQTAWSGAQDAALDLSLWAEPDALAQAQTHWGTTAQLQTAAQRRVISAQGPWELAQFELSSATQNKAQHPAGHRALVAWRALAYDPAWRTVRWALLVLTVTWLVGLKIWVWQHEAALQDLRGQAPKILLQSFPQTPVVLDAPAQMQKAVQTLRESRKGGSRSDLERMLWALVGAMQPDAQQTMDAASAPLPASEQQASASAPRVAAAPAMAGAAPTETAQMRQKGRNADMVDDEADEKADEKDDESEPPPLAKKAPATTASGTPKFAAPTGPQPPAPLPVPTSMPATASGGVVDVPSMRTKNAVLGLQGLKLTSLNFQSGVLRILGLEANGEKRLASEWVTLLQPALLLQGYRIEAEGESLKVTVQP